MNRLLIAVLVLITCTSKTCADTDKFAIQIFQDGQVVEMMNQTVTLEKKPFVIQMTLFDHDGVFLSASYDQMYYGLEKNDPIPDFKYLNSKTMAEPSFNEKRELIVDPERVCYYFHTPDKYDWHRFDPDLEINGNVVTGTKTVEKLYDISTKTAMDVGQVEREIYLFFLATSEWPDQGPPEDLGRVRVRLVWK